VLRGLIAARLRSAASARGLTASWSALEVSPPLRVRLRGLVVARPGLQAAGGDTLVRAESLAVAIDPWALLILRPRLTSLDLAHAAIRLPSRRGADPDTTLPEERPSPRDRRQNPERAERVRSLARSVVGMLSAATRELPRLALRDVTIATAPDATRPGDAPPTEGYIAWLALAPADRGVRLETEGRWPARPPIPFSAAFDYRRDDRIAGGARFTILSPGSRRPDVLRLTVDGSLHQDRGAGRVTIADTTRVTIGSLRFRLGGEAAREGPRFRLALAADSLTAAQWKESLPRAVLGPLLDLAVRGWYGYHVGLDLDLTRPDSVEFTADVRPHGLQLDSLRTGLNLLSLGEPFVAAIHLPRDRIVERDLSDANPHFRPLAEIDSLVVHAVVTNEDGAFFRHGGFNTEAVKGAIADNIKAGAFRRGAGTITMQLVRNLYLGHARTLSRKGQEVVLAWVLEHLTPVTKERMLEIYLNIIEWGPEIHGADEATHYYFGHDANRVTVDEALFLATVVPAPTKWRYRFDATGALRPFERAQMHFIGRAMVARGRLAADRLPPAESLRVELKGPARDLLFPPVETHADTTET
jgi:transglycosylase-like protein